MMNSELLIQPTESIKQTLRILNKTAMKVLFVVDIERHLLGSLSDGDIRRALLSDVPLDSTIEKVYSINPVKLVFDTYSQDDIKALFLQRKVELIPIVDSDNKIVDVISWSDQFKDKRNENYTYATIDIPVVIMAGGKGTRLAPFTNVLPKPLIPIGEKTILELILDEFKKFGVKVFDFTLNYRGEMIRAYFEGLDEKYPIRYFWEKGAYGTAGSLTLIAEEISGSFIVSNCDIIVKTNYAEILAFHKKSQAFLTIISSMKHLQIPYGVVNFQCGGEVISIHEKPEYTFPINTGVYILEKECLGYIPHNQVFHMTNLINALLEDNRRVVTYPINESDYIDVGQWEEYRNAVKIIGNV